jgi:polysaccharide biosynthesis transport protein
MPSPVRTNSPIIPVGDSAAHSGGSPLLRFDLGYLFRLMLSKAWFIILVVLLALSAAIAYLIVTPKIYESLAVIEVQQEAQKLTNIQDIDKEEYKDNDALKTVEQSLLSDTLLLRVVKANGLDKDPEFAPAKKDRSAYSDIELAGLLKSKVTVLLRRGTRLIDVSVDDKDPERTQQLAKSMINEYQALFFERNSTDTKAGYDALIQESDRLKTKLHNSEQALQQYREEHHAVSLEDKQNIVVEKLKELNQKVTDARSERIKLEADIATIQHTTKKNPEQLLLLSSVASLPVIADLRREISDKEADFAQINERYGELHPKYIEAQAQIKDLKQTLNRTLLNSADLVMKSYEAAKATEDKLRSELKDQEDAALELNKIAIPYNVLVREEESDRALYDAVLKRMKETNVKENVEENNIRLIADPLVPVKPSKPSKLKILALAFLGGLVIACGSVFGIDLINTSMRSASQVEELLGLPVLTSIPRSRRKHLDRIPVISANGGSHEAEAFRSLRTALSFLGPAKDFKTVLFTSANPGEGKTYCSLNCAAALAQLGLRTLLIDADLRRPNLSKAPLAERKGPGLTACLSGRASLMDCCQATDTENLFVLSAGERVSEPAELLATGDLAGLLNEAKLHFDRIVLDSAPVNAVSDTQLVAREIELVCLVVWARKTPRNALIRACDHLSWATHRPDAVVLNRMRRGAHDYYYFDRYASMYATAKRYRYARQVGENGSAV